MAGRGGIGRFMRQQKKEERKKAEGYTVRAKLSLSLSVSLCFWQLPLCFHSSGVLSAAKGCRGCRAVMRLVLGAVLRPHTPTTTP
jgi:hypothetical protein